MICHAARNEDTLTKDLLRFAWSMNIKNAQKIMNQVEEAVAKWDVFANEIAVDTSKKETIQNTLISLKSIS